MVAAVAELLMFKLGHCEIQFRPLRDKMGSAHKTYRDLGPIQETWRDPLDQKSAPGLVSRASPVHTARRNCTGDEGGPFGFGDQVVDPKPPRAAVVKSHGR
jgi:hypothetical protein